MQKFEEKYKGQGRKSSDSDDEFHTPTSTSRDEINTNKVKPKAKKLDYFTERDMFKQFLQTQPGFEDSEP